MITIRRNKNHNGVALVTVMGFILILSLLMVPLAVSVFQLTSSANVIKEDVILTETRNSAVELVRYNLAFETPTTAIKVGMAQGQLELQPVSCTGTTVNLANRPTYRYCNFEVVLAPVSEDDSTLSFTGSAVVQVLGGNFPNRVYVTHIEEK